MLPSYRRKKSASLLGVTQVVHQLHGRREEKARQDNEKVIGLDCIERKREGG
jgi:predicted transcriptional regulator